MPSGAVPNGTDYAVAFRLDPIPRNVATAEHWARAVFEGPPGVVRLGLQFGWRVLLRLKLGSSTSLDTVAGWPVAESTSTRCVLRASSPLMSATNSATVDDAGVLWLTEVNFNSRLGHVLWALAAPIHQLTLPIFLRMAARSLKA